MGCDVILSTGLFPATASMGLDDEPAAGELAAGELAAGGLAAGEPVTARELAISGDLAESGEGDSERARARERARERESANALSASCSPPELAATGELAETQQLREKRESLAAQRPVRCDILLLLRVVVAASKGWRQRRLLVRGRGLTGGLLWVQRARCGVIMVCVYSSNT
jgi:hypothetical protein